jgi:LysR family transcriptional regulator for metE and metH
MNKIDMISCIHLFFSCIMIERIHLLILREVAQRGSLTAAAEALHLTQSALSHAIRKLEGQLGVDVWVRDGRSLRPTPAGSYLLALAKRLLPQFEHAERLMAQYAQGQRGTLRIGMECAPCYQWLLKVVAPYLAAWPDVDVDVKQRFQFGGIKALEEWEIDVLVTPDPVHKAGLGWVPVFDYEQVLVVANNHPLAGRDYVEPCDLVEEVLITYPVDIDRLDIYNAFFLPAACAPRQRKTIETTDILLQMVASGRGVAALPRWLVEEYGQRMPVLPVRLGRDGIPKSIFLGTRADDAAIDYQDAFLRLAAGIGDNA